MQHLQAAADPALSVKQAFKGGAVGQAVGQAVGRAVGRVVGRVVGRAVVRAVGRAVGRSSLSWSGTTPIKTICPAIVPPTRGGRMLRRFRHFQEIAH